jgi:hypothetical protein
VIERGQEQRRATTRDEDELLWLVFQSVTFSLAGSFELRNRAPRRDSRRIAFSRQVELLAQMSPTCAARQVDDHLSILSKYPFDDRAANGWSCHSPFDAAGTSRWMRRGDWPTKNSRCRGRPRTPSRMASLLMTSARHMQATSGNKARSADEVLARSWTQGPERLTATITIRRVRCPA